MSTRFVIHIPATTANLGSGFDCLGLALDLHNTIEVEDAPQLELFIRGEGDTTLPRTAANRVVKAMQRLCDEIGKPLPPVRLCMNNLIPLARGLGSSSAAAVGGLVAANRLHGNPLGPEQLLALAVELEGHPDNVAPALLGGMCVVNMTEGRSVAVSFAWPAQLQVVVYVPDASLSTAKARGVLPNMITRGDAVFNVGRAALWVAAIAQQRYDLIQLATQDRLHQPYRASLVRGFDAICAAAVRAGALGAFLSGAGSSMAAIVMGNADAVADAMRQTAQGAGQPGRAVVLNGSPHGVRIELA
ncbi:MAG: homoserine kinase [Chloroflexi bacterium]|nr:homoserine kinase [Chloroflexota bacterium]